MSEEKLIERIREKATQEIERLRKERELKIHQLKKEFEDKQAELEGLYSQEKSNIRNAINREMKKVFQKEKLKLGLELDYFLSVQCRNLATELLKSKWGEYSEDFFRKYAEQYDRQEWAAVHVNSKDREVAEKYFRGLEVQEHEEMIGGFIIENKSGNFFIDNTLASRFEKIWPEILPEIIGKAYEKLDDKL